MLHKLLTILLVRKTRNATFILPNGVVVNSTYNVTLLFNLIEIKAIERETTYIKPCIN